MPQPEYLHLPPQRIEISLAPELMGLLRAAIFAQPIHGETLHGAPDQRMDQALALLHAITTKQELAMINAADVKAALDNLNTKEDVALAFMRAEKDQVTALQTTITDLQAQLVAAGTPVDLQPLVDQANAISSNIDAAMAVVSPPP